MKRFSTILLAMAAVVVAAVPCNKVAMILKAEGLRSIMV